jgi:ribonuclease BN (tRNA processing enzyme)
VKNLVLTHHEPAYDDKKVFGIWEEALEHKSHLHSSKVKIHLAREGMSFKI